MSTIEYKTSPQSTGGTTLLLVAFVVLKLTHVIAWSWWWVLAPLWVPAIFALVAIAILVAIAAVSR